MISHGCHVGIGTARLVARLRTDRRNPDGGTLSTLTEPVRGDGADYVRGGGTGIGIYATAYAL